MSVLLFRFLHFRYNGNGRANCGENGVRLWVHYLRFVSRQFMSEVKHVVCARMCVHSTLPPMRPLAYHQTRCFTDHFYHIAILWPSSFCIAEIPSEPLVYNRRPDQRQRNDGGAIVAGTRRTPVPTWPEPQEGAGQHFRLRSSGWYVYFLTGRVTGVRRI